MRQVDPLQPLLDLTGVVDAARTAQDAVLKVHRLPANLRDGSATAAEASIRAARASAGIDGADISIPTDGLVHDPVAAGALRIAKATEQLLPVWRRAPLQALATMHSLAAADLIADSEELGRPRSSSVVSQRLAGLAQLVTGGTSIPGAVLSAVVHGELLALEPFSTANGVVTRAAARLTMIASGSDPKALTVPEVFFLRRIAQYRAAVTEFSSGSSDGVRTWLLFYCEAIRGGAREATTIADAFTTNR